MGVAQTVDPMGLAAGSQSLQAARIDSFEKCQLDAAAVSVHYSLFAAIDRRQQFQMHTDLLVVFVNNLDIEQFLKMVDKLTVVECLMYSPVGSHRSVA